MLRFWNVINCVFVNWTKKLTLIYFIFIWFGKYGCEYNWLMLWKVEKYCFIKHHFLLALFRFTDHNSKIGLIIYTINIFKGHWWKTLVPRLWKLKTLSKKVKWLWWLSQKISMTHNLFIYLRYFKINPKFLKSNVLNFYLPISCFRILTSYLNSNSIFRIWIVIFGRYVTFLFNDLPF